MKNLSAGDGKSVLSRRDRAYNRGMLPNRKGAKRMEFDIDDLIFGDADPGPSSR